jgi:hypothetical protein
MTRNEILVGLQASTMTKSGKQDFVTQSIPQKVFSAIWALEEEVNNGGFSQYFQNSSAETTPFIVEALDTIGASRAAAICKDAIATAFPSGLPSTPETVSSAANALSDAVLEKLNDLDTEFYRYPDNLTILLFSFVSKHPDEFGEIPTPSDG